METFPQSDRSVTSKWAFTQSDFDRFANLSGDNNPIHVDPVFAAQTHFGRTVAHGMLLFSVLCGQLQQHMTGRNSLVVAQEMMFSAPTFAEESLAITLKGAGVDEAASTANVETTFEKADGSFGLTGQAAVYWGDKIALPKTAVLHPRPSTISTAQSYKGMVLGQKAGKSRTLTAVDLAEYADLSGDHNPLFSDVAYARERALANLMIPLPLLCALFSDLLGTELPGPGTNWLKLKVALKRPAIVEETVTVVVEIIRLRPEKGLVNLRTVCNNSDGDPLCFGEALVLVKDVVEQ